MKFGFPASATGWRKGSLKSQTGLITGSLCLQVVGPLRFREGTSDPDGGWWKQDEPKFPSILSSGLSFFFFPLFCLSFLEPHPRQVKIPRLGAESDLQPPTYATAPATRDPSRVCDLHHSSWQRQFLNPLSKSRDGSSNLTVPSRICFHGTARGTPGLSLLRCPVLQVDLCPPLTSDPKCNLTPWAAGS